MPHRRAAALLRAVLPPRPSAISCGSIRPSISTTARLTARSIVVFAITTGRRPNNDQGGSLPKFKLMTQYRFMGVLHSARRSAKNGFSGPDR
jgi:hypothetical protein